MSIVHASRGAKNRDEPLRPICNGAFGITGLSCTPENAVIQGEVDLGKEKNYDEENVHCISRSRQSYPSDC